MRKLLLLGKAFYFLLPAEISEWEWGSDKTNALTCVLALMHMSNKFLYGRIRPYSEIFRQKDCIAAVQIPSVHGVPIWCPAPDISLA